MLSSLLRLYARIPLVESHLVSDNRLSNVGSLIEVLIAVGLLVPAYPNNYYGSDVEIALLKPTEYSRLGLILAAKLLPY